MQFIKWSEVNLYPYPYANFKISQSTGFKWPVKEIFPIFKINNHEFFFSDSNRDKVNSFLHNLIARRKV